MSHTGIALGYTRVSTERQADEGRTSLSDQQAAIEAKAAALGTTVTLWFRDEGASGATAAGRPAFSALIEYCESNPQPRRAPGDVLVMTFSRFGRFDNPEEAPYWRHRLLLAGWVVRFAEGDVEGDVAPIMRAVGDVEASTYRRNLRANTRRGMKGAASQGYWTREAPFGFRRMVVLPPESARVLEVGQLKAPNEKVKLVPHTVEAKIVAWAYRAYAEREHTACSLARELKTIVPSKPWGPQLLLALLRNPAYCGDVLGGRRRGESDTAHIRAVPELYGMRNAHEPIVSRELWEAAQHRMSENRKIGRGVASTYLLSGLLHCPYCTGHYVGGGGGRKFHSKTRRERRRFYRDAGGMDGICPGRIGTVMRYIIEDAVIATMTKTIRSRAVRGRVEQHIERALSGSPDAGESEATLRRTRSRLDERRDRLIALMLNGTVTQAEGAGQMEQLRTSIADTERRIESLRFVARRRVPRAEERDRLVQMVMDFPALAQRLKGPALRALLERWLAAATFDKVTRELELHIRPVPSLAFQPATRAGRDDPPQGPRPLIRRVNLIQPGYSPWAQLEAMERGA